MTNSPEPPGIDSARVSESLTRARRESVMLSATVERFGGSVPTNHRVRDLSTGGVRIDQATCLQAGATILVSVGTLQAVGATVVWVKSGSAGLKFAEPINPDNARAKAAIVPRAIDDGATDVRNAGPTAGWMPSLNNPYRK